MRLYAHRVSAHFMRLLVSLGTYLVGGDIYILYIGVSPPTFASNPPRTTRDLFQHLYHKKL